MPAPHNRFKAALRTDAAQIGLWLGLANAYTAELCGGLGFDWVLLDGEHGPNDVPLLAAQLQALAASSSSAVVRVPVGETWILKQVLDIGAQTVLVPMVESAEQAKALVSAVRYPPEGVRGAGAALARASAFNRIPDYLITANREIALLVQVETRKGLAAIEEIAAVEGVDGLFIGPADLAADMGYLGQPGHPEVRAAVEEGIRRIQAAGKPVGTLAADLVFAQRALELGATFVAVGTDVGLLVHGGQQLAQRFKSHRNESPKTGGGY